MNWRSGTSYVRRLVEKQSAVGLGNPLDDMPAALWILVDLCVCLATIAGGATVSGGQICGLVAAAALNYVVILRPRIACGQRTGEARLYFHLIVVTLLALSVRSGVLSLLISGGGWPAQAAVAVAVILTAAVALPGFSLSLSVSKWSLDEGAAWRVLAVGLVAYACVLRLIYCSQVELLPEEAYYWNYSRHLDIGYLDHPPMVAWMIHLGTAVFGDTEFGVRCGALCCGAVASFFTYRLTRNLFGESSALLALVLAQVLPFFFLAGLLMTPDAPLTAAWAATLFFLERALVGGRAGAWGWAGICMGLGLLSKYTIGLLGLAAFIFMLAEPSARHWLRRWEPYAAALLMVAVFFPVILWNAQHDWASFAFQTSRRLAESPRFALHKLIAAAVVLLTPTGFLAVLVALCGRRPDAGAGPETGVMEQDWRLLKVCVLVPLAVFVVFSLRHEVKLDWTGAPWVAALPALGFGMAHAGATAAGFRAGIRAAWVPSLIAMLMLYGVGLYHLAAGIPGLGYAKHTELLPVGWRDLGRQITATVQDIQKRTGAAPLVVGMDRYAIASELAFYAPDHDKSVNKTSAAHLLGGIGLMYERWFPPELQRGSDLLLVAFDPAELAVSRIAPRVDGLEPLNTGVLMRDGNLIRRYYYRLVHGYRVAPTSP